MRGKIDYYELATPISAQFFCWYEKGEIYGFRSLTHNVLSKIGLRPKTEIEGLYLTGQDIMTCGVVGAMIGGLMTAVTIGVIFVKALPLPFKRL